MDPMGEHVDSLLWLRMDLASYDVLNAVFCICLPRIRKSAKPLAFRYCRVEPQHQTRQEQFGTGFLCKLIDMSTNQKPICFRFKKIMLFIKTSTKKLNIKKRTQHMKHLITQPPFKGVWCFNSITFKKSSILSAHAKAHGLHTTSFLWTTSRRPWIWISG